MGRQQRTLLLTAAATTPSELRTNTELKFNMSGYPGGGYPRPGTGAPPGAYPGSAPSPGGYPGQNYNGGPARPPPPGQYGSAPPQNHGYGGAPPPSQGYGGAPPPSQGYGGAPPPNQGYGGAPPPNQFGGVDAKVQQWFNAVDQDRSGFIEQAELTQAFNQMGYRFTPTFIQNVLSKYEPRTRRLTLDNFIVVCVQIKRLTDSFRTRDREMRGQAMLQYEDFIGLAL